MDTRYAVAKGRHSAATKAYQEAIRAGTNEEMIAAMGEVEATHGELLKAARLAPLSQMHGTVEQFCAGVLP